MHLHANMCIYDPIQATPAMPEGAAYLHLARRTQPDVLQRAFRTQNVVAALPTVGFRFIRRPIPDGCFKLACHHTIVLWVSNPSTR